MALKHALQEIRAAAEEGNLQISVVSELVERSIIEGTLKKWGWCKVRAAEALNMHRNTMLRLCIKYEIRVPADAEPLKHARRVGRPSKAETDAAKLVAAEGVSHRNRVANGLDRDISPLVLRCRLNQIERAKKKAERRQTRSREDTKKIEAMSNLVERMEELKRLGA